MLTHKWICRKMCLRGNNVIWMGMVSFFTDFASSLVMPILPIFVVLVLDQGIDKFGLVVASTTLVSYLLRYVGGALSDRYQNNKRFLLVGYGLSALAKPCLAVSSSWLDVSMIRAVERLGKAVRAAPKDKLLSSSMHSTKIGRGIGLHKAIEKSGELLGLASLLAIVVYFGTSEVVLRNVFTFSFIPGVLAVVILSLMVKETSGRAVMKKPKLSLALEPGVRRPILAYSLLCLGMFNEGFFLLIGNEMGIALPALLCIYIGSRVLQILISLKVGALIDSSPIQRLVMLGYCSGLGSLLLLLLGTLPSFVIAFMLFGLYDVITLNAIRSYIGRYAVDKGATFGGLYLVVAIASALGAYGLSVIWQRWSVNVSIGVALIVVIVSGAVIAWLFKPEEFGGNLKT